MTTLDDTRYCPMCEDAAKKILELEQRVKVLTDALWSIKNLACGEMRPNWTDSEATYYTRGKIADLCEVINATPQQTAAQIERWHIEWMMKLPVAFRAFECCGVLSENAHSVDSNVVDLYQIPPLPKESKE